MPPENATPAPPSPRKLSREQQSALGRIKAWLGPPGTPPDQQVFRLWGCAGTGKSTVLAKLPMLLGPGRTILYGAFTGKAASVLRAKGCSDAATLHSLAYRPTFTQTESGRKALETFERDPESPIARADLLVIDEASMIGPELGKVLLSFGTPVLVVGDPMQLPPVKGTGFFTQTIPDFLLRETHRQSENTGLGDFATEVRQGRRGSVGDFGSHKITSLLSLTVDDLFACDQILVGRNATRDRVNERIRELLGRAGPLPEPGDKLVCRKNNATRGFFNGQTWLVLARKKGGNGIRLRLAPEGVSCPSAVRRVTLPEEHFTDAGGAGGRPSHRERNRFEYGFALTVHLAQGSEWPNVLLIDEAEHMGENARSWLYTAVTRASQRLTIARPPERST